MKITKQALEHILGNCFLDDYAMATAKQMAYNKERAIRAAIDYFFGDGLWTESMLDKVAAFTHHHDGREIFTMNDIDMLEFGPIQTNTIVDRHSVICQFSQEIKVLYHD